MIILHKRCFKIDKTNAKAMIEGYSKNGQHIRQAIWCDVHDKPFPMLITLNRTDTKFPMSLIGQQLNPELFSIPYKYVAVLDSEYFIKNNIGLWETLCTNGLFDIWKPIAPYARFIKAKTRPNKFRICLLRLYEIQEQFSASQILNQNPWIDHLAANNYKVTLEEPIIANEEFMRIKELLQDTVQKHLIPKKNSKQIDCSILNNFEENSPESELNTEFETIVYSKHILRKHGEYKSNDKKKGSTIAFRLNNVIDTKLRAKAAKEGVKLSTLIETILNEYVDGVNNDTNKRRLSSTVNTNTDYEDDPYKI